MNIRKYLRVKCDFLLYYFVFCLAFLFLFHNFFFKANTFYERDSTLLETPLRMHCIQLIKEGNFALWTNAHGNGQPFLANPKMAVFYPTTWLYLFLPFFIAFKIHYFIHPLIGWLGMYLLAKSYGLSKRASFLATTLFFLSGIYLSSFEFYNHVAATTWMMWALYLQRVNPAIKSIKFILSIFVWVLLIIAGAPEFIIITGIVAIAQCFIEPKGYKSHLLKLFLVVFMACLIAAVQILPSLEMLSQTSRKSLAEMWQLEFIQLFNLVFPYFLGDDRQPGQNNFWGGHFFDNWYPLYYSFYIGFGAILLFIFSFRTIKIRQEKILAILSVIFFLISCGKYLPFFLIYSHFPLLSSIRFPVKFFLGSFFCFCLMAGAGIEKLSVQSLGRFFSKSLFILTIICLVLFFFFKSPLLSKLYDIFVIDDQPSRKLLIISITTGLIVLLVYSTIFVLMAYLKKIRQTLIFILMVACLADPAYHNRYINPTVSESFFKEPEILKEMARPSIIYRNESLPFILGITNTKKLKIMAYYLQSLFPFSGVGYGIRYVFNTDFMSSYPESQHETMKMIRKLSKENKLKILSYLGCQYYLGMKPLFYPDKAKRFFIEEFPLYVEELDTSPPHPFLVFNFIQADLLEEKLQIFIKSDFSPKQTAILDTKFNAKQEINFRDSFVEKQSVPFISKDDSIETIVEKSGYGKYVINLRRPGIAIFPGNWARGWKCLVDGKKSIVFSANIFSKGIFLPPGKHEVILKYLPDSFIYGSIISIFALVCSVTIWILIHNKI